MGTRLKRIMEPFDYQDEEKLLEKARELKQTDGEGWVIGEVVERLLAFTHRRGGGGE